MKRVLLSLCLLFLAAPVFANSQFGGFFAGISTRASSAAGGGGGGGGADADVKLYFNCDQDDTSQTPQKGVGTLTVNSNFSVDVGSVTNSLRVSGSNCRIQWPYAGSGVTASSGAVGFFLSVPTYGGGATYFRGNTGESDFYMFWDGGSTRMRFNYGDTSGGVISQASLTNGATYFVVLRWSSDNAITGGKCLSIEMTDSSGTTLEGGDATCGNFPAAGANWEWGTVADGQPYSLDQIMMSTDPNEDLLSKRLSTSP